MIGVVSSAVLFGIGLPLYISGTRDLARRATTLRPWVTRRAAGVGFSMDL